MFDAVVAQFQNALLDIDRIQARHVLDDSRRRGVSDPIESIVVPALRAIGEGWAVGDVALSQVYTSGRICEQLIDALIPAGRAERRSSPRLAISVLEDYHMLGKRVVNAVVRAAGYDPIDYGRTTVDELAGLVQRDDIEILLVSTLMLRAALRVEHLCSRLRSVGSTARVVVGGAPFVLDDLLWREVGADAMGRTASDAIGIIRRLAGEA